MPKPVKKQPGDTRGAWRKRVGMGGVCLMSDCRRRAHMSSNFCTRHCPMYPAGFKAGKKAACAAVRKYAQKHPLRSTTALVYQAVDGISGVHADRCPECYEPQVTRTNSHTGQQFQGCSAFPKCHWSLQTRGDDEDDGGQRAALFARDAEDWKPAPSKRLTPTWEEDYNSEEARRQRANDANPRYVGPMGGRNDCCG